MQKEEYNKEQTEIERKMGFFQKDAKGKLTGAEYNRKADHMETALRSIVEGGRCQTKTAAHILLTMVQGTSDADDGCAQAQRAFVANLDQRTFHEPELKKIISLARDCHKADDHAAKQREAEQRKHKDEQRHEEQHRQEQRRKDQRREEQRREEQRREEQRREEQRREEQRREEQRCTQRLAEERERQQERSQHHGFHESAGCANGRELFVGPRGGVYHMSSGGNKIYHK